MREQTRELETLRRDAAAAASAEPYHRFAALTGRSPAMLELKRHLDRLVQVPWPVLIEGESGAGKELVARELHRSGPRRRRPFVVENCAAIPEPLLEAELFGARKGAFTGAIEDRPGLFEVANGGTLFLDEIAEMSLAMQAKVLRAIDTGEVRPVGARRSLRFDVRIIAATNKDLRAEVEAGRFREDLYYRINVIEIRVPPLRERAGDVPILVRHFVDRFARELGRGELEIDPGVLDALERYPFPGNVRELENLVERLVLLHGGRTVEPEDLAFDLGPPVRAAAGAPAAAGGGEAAVPRGAAGRAGEVAAGGPRGGFEPPFRTLREMERWMIVETLRRVGGNRTRAARELGIGLRTLRNKINEYEIFEPDTLPRTGVGRPFRRLLERRLEAGP